MSETTERGQALANTDGELRPAFSSGRQAFCFLMLLAAIFALPEMITRSGSITRRQSYEIMTEKHGGYAFVASEIFDNTEDIDVLFLGSSILFAGVDTPKVQQALSRQLGRRARAVTFGHYFNSLDVPYMQLRDVLERKRVRMVVLSIPRVPYPDGPSTTGCRFVRYADVREIFDSLPVKYQASMYACGLLRTPRDLLSMVRRDRIPPSSFADGLGMDKAEKGHGHDPRAFTKFAPSPPRSPASDMVFSDLTEGRFRFTNEDVPFYQNLYLERIAELCRRAKVPLVFLNIPQPNERNSEQVIERKNWKDVFGTDVPIIGVQPTVLFAGLRDDELDKLRFDDVHLNANGREFFTETILPAILKVYAENAK